MIPEIFEKTRHLVRHIVRIEPKERKDVFLLVKDLIGDGKKTYRLLYVEIEYQGESSYPRVLVYMERFFSDGTTGSIRRFEGMSGHFDREFRDLLDKLVTKYDPRNAD